MLIRKSRPIPYSEVTPKSAYLNRRAFMAVAGAAGVAAVAGKRIGHLMSLDAVRADTKLNWQEIRDLVEGSYQLVYVKKRRR